MSDGTVEFFNLDSLNHMESEYGLFVSNSGKDKDKLDLLKQLSQSMVQNGVPASTIAEMIDADSFSQIKEKIKDAEKTQNELQEAQSKAEQQTKQAQIQLQQDQLENDNMNKEKDRQTKIRVAEINAEAKMRSDEINREKGKDKITVRNKGGVITKSNKGSQDFRSGGMVLSTVDRRKKRG